MLWGAAQNRRNGTVPFRKSNGFYQADYLTSAGQETPDWLRLLYHTPRVSDSVGHEGAWEFAFLTSSQSIQKLLAAHGTTLWKTLD